MDNDEGGVGENSAAQLDPGKHSSAAAAFDFRDRAAQSAEGVEVLGASKAYASPLWAPPPKGCKRQKGAPPTAPKLPDSAIVAVTAS